MKLPTKRINRNGVSYIVQGNEVHTSYYVGDGVTLERTFKDLTKAKILQLSIDDFV